MPTTGKITQVIGSTFDAEFPEDQLPKIFNAVECDIELKPGETQRLVGEVQTHLGGGRVRCVALGATDGLRRGQDAVDTGSPVTAPVGEETLGRVFNLLGDTIDKRGPVATKERRLGRQRYCMAAAVYYEARGESRNGQLAVAQVVMNRVASKRYPNTVCGVVFQGEDKRNRCQFSFACDGKPERPRPGKAWNQALDIAKRFEGGERYSRVAEATHYHADYVKPRWSRSMRRISKIGRHIFLNGV